MTSSGYFCGRAMPETSFLEDRILETKVSVNPRSAHTAAPTTARTPASARAGSATQGPSHTVSHGRYLLFECPAARVQPRAPSCAVRRGSADHRHSRVTHQRGHAILRLGRRHDSQARHVDRFRCPRPTLLHPAGEAGAAERRQRRPQTVPNRHCGRGPPGRLRPVDRSASRPSRAAGISSLNGSASTRGRVLVLRRQRRTCSGSAPSRAPAP